MAWFGQYLGTTYTGQWWGDVGTAPPSNVGGGARPAGGWDERSDFETLFLRPIKIGRETVKVEDEQQLVEVVAERITDGEIEWSGNQPVFYEQPTIDWAAVNRMRAQSERLHQEVVLEAIRRVVQAVKDADDDDEGVLELMLIH